MSFAVVFTDKPDHGALRAEYLAAHIAWVDANKEQVLVAGSLRENPADVPKGGLWVVQAPEKADVHALMQTDPFYTCGLRQSVEVLHWSKALESHQALI
jgi:uncharacterized protein YciI